MSEVYEEALRDDWYVDREAVTTEFESRRREVDHNHPWSNWQPCTVSPSMAMLVYGGRTVRITIPEGDVHEVEFREAQRDYSDPRSGAAYELIDALRARLDRYKGLIDDQHADARRVEQVRRLAERLGQSPEQVDRVIGFVLRDALVVETEPS